MPSDQAPQGAWRILLTEDDGPVRGRLAALLNDWDGGELVGVCANLTESLDVIAAEKIDLLITDLKLPDGNGIDAIRALRRSQPEAEAIDLTEAVTELMAGRSPISSRIARVLVRRLGEQGRAAGPSSGAHGILTAREMDILWGVAKGFTYAELAERLGISRQTVPVHIRNIYRKLEASNRSEAVFEATRLGLIRL